jgi:hypothetical protein
VGMEGIPVIGLCHGAGSGNGGAFARRPGATTAATIGSGRSFEDGRAVQSHVRQDQDAAGADGYRVGGPVLGRQTTVADARPDTRP